MTTRPKKISAPCGGIKPEAYALTGDEDENDCMGKLKFQFEYEFWPKIPEEYQRRFARYATKYMRERIEYDDEFRRPNQTEETLTDIAATLREKIWGRQPITSASGKLPNEITRKPENEEEVSEVDEFLYPEEFRKENEISANLQCADCKSTKIKDLEKVSHSLSQNELTVLFTSLKVEYNNYEWKPCGKEEPKEFEVIVDIGSRTGCILYAAHLMTKAKEIVGIEIDKEWCKIQNEIVDKFQMQDRIKIVNEDAKSKKSKRILQKADLTIMNNPFQWFSKDNGKKDFECILQSLKPGSQVLLCHIEEEDIPINLDKYLRETTTSNCRYDIDHTFGDNGELEGFRTYKVITNKN